MRWSWIAAIVIVVVLILIAVMYCLTRDCDEVSSSHCLKTVRKHKKTRKQLRLQIVCDDTDLHVDDKHVCVVDSDADLIITSSVDTLYMTKHVPVLFTGNPLLIDYKHVNVDNLFIYGGTANALLSASFAQIVTARGVPEEVIVRVTTLITDNKSLVDTFIQKAVSIIPDLDVEQYKKSNVKYVDSIEEARAALNSLTQSNINVLYVVHPDNQYLPPNDEVNDSSSILFVPYLTYSGRDVPITFANGSAVFNVISVNNVPFSFCKSIVTGARDPVRYDVYWTADALERLMREYDPHLSIKGNLTRIFDMMFTTQGYMLSIVRFMTFSKNSPFYQISSGIYVPIGYTDVTSKNETTPVPYIAYNLLTTINPDLAGVITVTAAGPFNEIVKAELAAVVPASMCIYT